MTETPPPDTVKNAYQSCIYVLTERGQKYVARAKNRKRRKNLVWKDPFKTDSP